MSYPVNAMDAPCNPRDLPNETADSDREVGANIGTRWALFSVVFVSRPKRRKRAAKLVVFVVFLWLRRETTTDVVSFLALTLDVVAPSMTECSQDCWSAYSM